MVCKNELRNYRLSVDTRKERTSHERMSCPFYVSYDFAEVSRIVDVGGVVEIMGKGYLSFRGHIVDNMAYLPYTKYRKKIGDYNG